MRITQILYLVEGEKGFNLALALSSCRSRRVDGVANSVGRGALPAVFRHISVDGTDPLFSRRRCRSLPRQLAPTRKSSGRKLLSQMPQFMPNKYSTSRPIATAYFFLSSLLLGNRNMSRFTECDLALLTSGRFTLEVFCLVDLYPERQPNTAQYFPIGA